MDCTHSTAHDFKEKWKTKTMQLRVRKVHCTNALSSARTYCNYYLDGGGGGGGTGPYPTCRVSTCAHTPVIHGHAFVAQPLRFHAHPRHLPLNRAHCAPRARDSGYLKLLGFQFPKLQLLEERGVLPR